MSESRDVENPKRAVDDKYYDAIEEIYQKAGWHYNKQFHKNFDKFVERCRNCPDCPIINIRPADHLELRAELLTLVAEIPIRIIKTSHPLTYSLLGTLEQAIKIHKLNSHPSLPGE